MYIQIYVFVFVSINAQVFVSIKPASENSPNLQKTSNYRFKTSCGLECQTE